MLDETIRNLSGIYFPQLVAGKFIKITRKGDFD